MGRKASERPILGGPYILVYQVFCELPGGLPNEIIFRHPVTNARAVYNLVPESVKIDGTKSDMRKSVNER